MPSYHQLLHDRYGLIFQSITVRELKSWINVVITRHVNI